ncbi:hypothetical protein Hanom_Chr12g01089081 [Helianthus anomalus]
MVCLLMGSSLDSPKELKNDFSIFILCFYFYLRIRVIWSWYKRWFLCSRASFLYASCYRTPTFLICGKSDWG